MGELKNVQHEKFARAVVKSPTFQDAYKEVYDAGKGRLTSEHSISTNSSRLANHPPVRNRIAELLANDGVTVQRLNQKLGQLLEAKSEDVQLRSARLGYELHGALDKDDKNLDSGEINIQVNIINPQ